MAHQEPWIPSLPTRTFADRLRLLRIADGLSVEEMAKRCGFAVATWRTWEHGAHPRNMNEVVDEIYKATGVDPAWLMWGRPDPRPPISHVPETPDILLDPDYATAAGF